MINVKNFLMLSVLFAAVAGFTIAPSVAATSDGKAGHGIINDPRIILQYDFKSDGSCEVYGQLVDLETMKGVHNQIINYKYHTENYDVSTKHGIYVQSKATTGNDGKFKVIIPERCFTKYNEPITFTAEYNSAENNQGEGKDTQSKIKIPNTLEKIIALEGGFRG